MRTVISVIGLLLCANTAAAQTRTDDFIRMANDSIERANRRHAEERRYEQMRQDYIDDTQQAIRQEREDYEALQKLQRKHRRGLPPYDHKEEESDF